MNYVFVNFDPSLDEEIVEGVLWNIVDMQTKDERNVRYLREDNYFADGSQF